VPIGTAGTYGALACTGIFGAATINGDIGTTTATIDVSIQASGHDYGVGGDHNAQAQTDLNTALLNIQSRSIDQSVGDALGGLTLQRGIYAGGALDLASGATLTLNGSATDIFIIKAASSLTINTNSSVVLTGGAVWSNVFWYVGSSATIFSGSTFNGLVLAVVSITVNTGAASITAQLLANTGAITINSEVLPVELTSFTADINNTTAALKWITATEINNYGFEVQRSAGGGENSDTKTYNWMKVGFVKGAGTSNAPRKYSYIDNTLSYGTYVYRLKQIDNSGKYQYSDIIEVNTGLVPNGFLLNQNFPNPFNPTTQIQFCISKSTHATLSVFNILGEKVMTLFDDNVVANQIYLLTFNGNTLANGIYYYELQTKEKTQVKKMLLMK
jgi:hypothetical protein